MVKLLVFLLPLLIALAMWHLSARRMARDLDRRSTPLGDGRLLVAVDRLARALDLPRIPVWVYEIPQINGLAAPDGRVFVTRGLLEQYDRGAVSAEEIASVVAHELGHVALGHSRRRMVDFTGANALRLGLAMVLGRFIPFVGAHIAHVIATALQAALSRKDEYEADAYAAALMLKSGLGIEAQTSLLAKLDRMAGSSGRPPAWLMSHPASADRIRAIEAAAEGWLRRS
jgi:putative metalloprotease